MTVCFYFVAQSTFRFIKWNRRPFFLLLDISEAFICSYTVQPGIQLTILPEIFQSIPNPQKNILQYIIGILVIDHHTSDMPVQFFLVFFDYACKGLFLG